VKEYGAFKRSFFKGREIGIGSGSEEVRRDSKGPVALKGLFQGLRVKRKGEKM
jgi:hypothetical protein